MHREAREHMDLNDLPALDSDHGSNPPVSAHANPRQRRQRPVDARDDRHHAHQQLHEIERGADVEAID